MLELMHVAVSGEKHPVYDGKTIHKEAFPAKGKGTPECAAFVAGIKVALMLPADTTHILGRMEKVKTAFHGRVSYHVNKNITQRAELMKMKSSATGKEITSMEELMNELARNKSMDNFQKWYAVYHKEIEGKGKWHHEEENALMNEMNLTYHDKTTVGGGVGK